MSQATNGIGTVTFAYDDQGIPQQVAYPNGRSVYYGYNSDRQRSFVADSHGYNVTYQYNQKKQLTAIVHSQTHQPLVQFEYNSRGFLSRKTLGNGAFSLFSYVDGATVVESITNYNSNGSQASYYIYEYDPKARIIGIVSSEGNWTFGYDPAGQMVEWVNPRGDVTTYTYDGRSNRVVLSVNGRQSGYETNSVNQYVSFNQTERFNYDANGNLMNKTSMERNESYAFDAEGRLVQTEVPGKTYVAIVACCRSFVAAAFITNYHSCTYTVVGITTMH